MKRVYRCYTEKRPGFDVEASGLKAEIRDNLGVSALENIRLFNRYDVEGINEQDYVAARTTIFSEPQCDDCYDEQMPEISGTHRMLCVEALPGQYDQRADSCAQCIQIMTCQGRPLVRAARVYVLMGNLSDEDFATISGYLINPVESRQASEEKPETLQETYAVPESVKVLDGFVGYSQEELKEFLGEYGLAMDTDDLNLLQKYFRDSEKRNPTITEIRMIDTYWSDHCRHTTFGTHIDQVNIEDERVAKAYKLYIDARKEIYGDEIASKRPVTLMDIATCAVKLLKKHGGLKEIDESEEINACSIHVTANVNGKEQDWLLMFKNETHNHPTEIEPFGGAATCLGGAIRDPLSGRSYVYQAMRVTGSGDPRTPVNETIPGKLPQRKITQTAAAGYSSYGNQIGLATGLVHEFYHPGYVAKRMEIGAVVGAAPAENVRRERPAPGDVVILLGGRTGRDGCGGATGSSKTHTLESLTECGSEVQKGNPPEERKIQRLFRKSEVTQMIKRCNDFGAGGVSVAIGELADGLIINLDRVPKKYEGLDGTELAISESQERMAVVVAKADAERFILEAQKENLEAVEVATVTEEARLRMNWNGKTIVDISREFLNSNGAEKHTSASVKMAEAKEDVACSKSASERLKALAGDLNVASQRGLGERFDASIGAGSVLHPFGGKNQLTPVQAMAAKLPVISGETDTCSVMAFGFNPYMSEKDPYAAAECAVVESVAKLVSTGCDYKKAYLTFQEYFERLKNDAYRWGKPFAALLGAFRAQVELGLGAIGGKDSMSGSFMDMDVPPTLVSFAIAPEKTSMVLSPEFKQSGNPVCMFAPDHGDENISFDSVKATWDSFRKCHEEGKILSAWSLTAGGAAEGILKMSMGNDIGFKACVDADVFFDKNYGAIIAECSEVLPNAVLIGYTTDDGVITLDGTGVKISELKGIWEGVFEPVFPTRAGKGTDKAETVCGKKILNHSATNFAKPKAVIPVFPGTNCEYDTARAVERAGGTAEIVVVRNLNQQNLEESVAEFVKALSGAQMLILPGGFSGGDEPEGSGKFIASFLRNPSAMDAVHRLLSEQDGLALGICNGFQALVKLGLVPYGEIRNMTPQCPTLTFNLIGRHQSRYAYTQVASNHSPWLSKCNVGDVFAIPMSHGEGRFVAPEDVLEKLRANGQIATCYVNANGQASSEIEGNLNGSMLAIEGITSPDGRVLGKMGHSERWSRDVAKNIIGNKFQPLFEGGVEYFK